MEKADVKKMIHMALVALLISVQKGTGFSTSPSALTSCDSSTAYISFNFRIDATESIFGKRIWFFGADKIAESDGTTLTPVPSYSSRLTAYGTSGISLSNVTAADAGTYTYVIVLFPTASPFTATTALSVQVAPLAPPSGCQVSATQSINILTCAVNTKSGNCGTPSLNAFWVNSTNTSNQIKCNDGETYQCCATGAAFTCYSGNPNEFCKLFTCTGTTTTTTITVTSSFLSSTSTATTDNTLTKPTTNGQSVSATTSRSPTITVLPRNYTNNTSTSRSPTGSNVSATSNISASTSSTAVSPANNTSNASTSTNPTKAEPTAITKTSTGNNGIKNNISDTDIKVIVPAVVVPCGLLIIGAVVLVVFCVRRKARKNVHESPDGMAIQDKGNNIDGWKQSLGHGKATDNLDTVYTTPDGFIIYPGQSAVYTARSYKDKKYHGVTDQYSRPSPGTHHHQADYIPSTYTSAGAYTHRDKKHHVVIDHYSRPYPGNYGNQSVYFPSTFKSVRTYAQKGKTYERHQPASNPMATSRLAYDLTVCFPQTGYYGQIDDKLKREPTYKKSKTNNSGSSSAVSRDRVSVQMESKGFKSNEEERPPTVHTKSQDKVEPNTISEQTNYRQQPLPPVDTEFEDTPYRRLPQSPQNREIKDRNLRGISGTIDDTPGLASETPRPNKLPPLTPKQTVQKEDASEEPKKKKKKKKKDQMNVEIPEEENGETIL